MGPGNEIIVISGNTAEGRKTRKPENRKTGRLENQRTRRPEEEEESKR